MEVYWCVQPDGKTCLWKEYCCLSDSRSGRENHQKSRNGCYQGICGISRMQGSTHADHYYSNYTRLAYKSVGITDKTTAAGSQLDDLSLVEHLITHTLRTGMAAGRNYKDIYQDCKNRLEAMRYLQCTAWNVLFAQSTGIKQGENGWKQCKGIFV